MAEPVKPLCELPECLLCQQPLLRLEQPVLLPCTHYVVCSLCWARGTEGPGRVKCPLCPQIYSNLTPDHYLTEVGDRLRAAPREALAPVEEEEKYQLAVYLLHCKEAHTTDLTQIPLCPEAFESQVWDCFYCGERANDQLRCKLCRRVNWDRVGEEPLPESIAAVFPRKEEMDIGGVLLAFPRNMDNSGKLGMCRAVIEETSIHPPPSIKQPMVYTGNLGSSSSLEKPKPDEKNLDTESFLLDESGEWRPGVVRPGPEFNSLPSPQPYDKPVKDPENIQLPPEPIQIPENPPKEIPKKRQPKEITKKKPRKHSCCQHQ